MSCNFPGACCLCAFRIVLEITLILIMWHAVMQRGIISPVLMSTSMGTKFYDVFFVVLDIFSFILWCHQGNFSYSFKIIIGSCVLNSWHTFLKSFARQGGYNKRCLRESVVSSYIKGNISICWPLLLWCILLSNLSQSRHFLIWSWPG